jgi:hypothetical protein
LRHEGGKLDIEARIEVRTLQDTRDIYTPGVARVPQAIADDSAQLARYTMVGRTVAICTTRSDFQRFDSRGTRGCRRSALTQREPGLHSPIGGECPSVYAAYRFAAKLRAYSDLLDACIARVLDRLHRENPDFGRDLAIDASDLPAYANGQRYLSKNGPERKRFSDPDASWGHRSAVSTRKGGGFYGFKVHAAVCAQTDLPVAWQVETARAHESSLPPGCSTRRRIAALPPMRPRSTWATTPKRSTPPARFAAPVRSSRSSRPRA